MLGSARLHEIPYAIVQQVEAPFVDQGRYVLSFQCQCRSSCKKLLYLYVYAVIIFKLEDYLFYYL